LRQQRSQTDTTAALPSPRVQSTGTRQNIVTTSPSSPDPVVSEADPAALRQTIAEQTSHLDRLAATIDSLIERQQELRRLLQDAHAQLVERDDEIARLRARERDLDTQLAVERKRLRRLQGSRWWRLRQTIARVVGR
jgi:septal ring factor EnvC (AmiA/AmiB activator)